jgi:hypothetical protein
LETSELTEIVDEYEIPAKSHIFVYKRRYNFKNTVWFMDPRGKEYLEGPKGEKIQAVFASSITADQELISPVQLQGIGTVTETKADILAPTRGIDLWRACDPDKTSGVAFYIWARAHSFLTF